MAGVIRGFVLAMIGVLTLAGCGSKAPTGAAIDSEQLNAIASSGPTVAEVLAQGNDSVPDRPAPTGFDHLGRWAASPALCPTQAWRFTADAVSSGDGARCGVTQSEVVAEGSKKLTVACRFEGHETIESWALVAREDGSMTVARTEGGNGVPRSVTLRRCG